MNYSKVSGVRIFFELYGKIQLFLLQLRIHQMATEMKLQPFAILLRNTLDQLQELDSGRIFAEPVDRDEVVNQI